MLVIKLLASLLIACTVLFVSCLGPKPEVKEVRTTPATSQGEAYRLEVLIENTGPGKGQVQVTAQLREKGTGLTVAEEDRKIDLDLNEREIVSFSFPVDPSKQYEPTVEADYPVK